MGACACVDWVVLFRGRLFLSVVLLIWALAPRDDFFFGGICCASLGVVHFVAGC